MAAALKSWELENAVALTDPTRDALYTFSEAEQKAINNAKPWKEDGRHFTNVRISAVALLKMTMHARSGGSVEIMGLMQGYVSGHSLIVTDALRLPVEGTETRVNAQDEANEYMVTFLQSAREAGQLENAVGWYHSHPGYGCWLSGIDVMTQATQQMFQDPFVAVVIDPDRTISAGKVEIGAFRTFPGVGATGESASGSVAPGEKKKDEAVDEDDGEDADGFQSIPLGKIEDFGAYADKYYSLEVSHFKSSLDAKLLEALWNKYWVSTLAASPLLTNREYGTRKMGDLAMKVKQHSEGMGGRLKIGYPGAGMMGKPGGGKKEMHREEQLEKIVKAGRKVAMDEESGLMAGEIKERLFSGLGQKRSEAGVAAME